MSEHRGIDGDGDAMMSNEDANPNGDDAESDGDANGNDNGNGNGSGNGMDNAVAKLTTYITAYLIESHAFLSQLYADDAQSQLELRADLGTVMSGPNRMLDFCVFVSAEAGGWDSVLDTFHPFLERAELTGLVKLDRSRYITRMIVECAKETWQSLIADDTIWQSLTTHDASTDGE